MVEMSIKYALVLSRNVVPYICLYSVLFCGIIFNEHILSLAVRLQVKSDTKFQGSIIIEYRMSHMCGRCIVYKQVQTQYANDPV